MTTKKIDKNPMMPEPGECDVEVPKEVIDFARFLAKTWNEIDVWAYKHCDGEALMHYPVIQGTSNQVKLRRIAEQPYDQKNLAVAIDWLTSGINGQIVA